MSDQQIEQAAGAELENQIPADGSPTTEAPPVPVEPTLTAKEEKKIKEYLLKVNGKEKNVKLDLTNDEEIKKYLQKAYASDEAFQSASEVRKAALEFVEELKKNPKRVLSDPSIGIDVRQFAEAILNEELSDLEKTPEQKERERLERELLDLKEQARQQAEAAQQAEIARIQIEQERIIENEIAAALETGGMPKTARTVKSMAEMMMVAIQNGIDLKPADIMKIVKKNTMSDFKEIVDSLGDDQLEDFLGKSVISRLRKRNMAKANLPSTANQIQASAARVEKKEQQPEKKQTIKQFFGV